MKPRKVPIDWSYLSYLKVVGGIYKIVFPCNLQSILCALQYAVDNNFRPYFLGGGSNTLIGNLHKTMIFSDLCIPPQGKKVKEGIVFSCNTNINLVINHALAMGLGGLEFLAGIPAHLGGCVAMNAGAYGKTISDYVVWVTAVTYKGEKKIYKDEIQWGYRTTNISGFITSVCLRFDKYPSISEGEHIIKQAILARKKKHPMNLPSLGSFFKNPKPLIAGELIESAGLKGFQIGGARVSEKHANFLVNAGHATFEDFIKLSRHVKAVVEAKHNIILEEEVKILYG